MGEEQPEQNPESESGIDLEALKALAAELREQGADIEDEDFEDMPADQVMEQLIIAGEIADIDVQNLLVERGIIEDIYQTREDVFRLQNQGDGSYYTQGVDRLVNEDPPANT